MKIKILRFLLLLLIIFSVTTLCISYDYRVNAAVKKAKKSSTNISTRIRLSRNSRGGLTSITVKASAYTSNKRTSSGTKPRRDSDGISTIAVDPNVIPIGTKVYVEGYGFAIAEDIGSSIKGCRIDVYFPTERECLNWGIRYVKVSLAN